MSDTAAGALAPPKEPAASRVTGGARRPALRNIGPPLALVVLCAVVTAINPVFLSGRNLTTLADQAAVLLIVSVGATFVIMLGGIDLSVDGVMAASALTVALLIANNRNDLGLGPFGLLLAVGVGAAFGLVNGLGHTLLKVPSFVITLGTWSVGLGVATVLFGGQTPQIQDEGLRGLTRHGSLGVSPLVIIAAACAVGGLVIQRYTRLGRYTRVIGGNEGVARQAGIGVDRYKTCVFVLAGSLSGLAGVCAALRLGVGDTGIGANTMFAGVSAVVVGGTLLTGGRGGVGNTVIGVLIITVVDNGLVLAGVSPFIQQSVQGVVIVTAVAASGWSHRSRMRVIR